MPEKKNINRELESLHQKAHKTGKIKQNRNKYQ